MTTGESSAVVVTDFGRRLARRVTARAGVRRHAGATRSIGLVSRSAVGFGQAIGRSRQTRPNVTAESLASLRLRPPAGWWHTLGDGEPAAPAWDADTWTDDLVPPTRHTFRPTAPRPAASRPAAGPATAAQAAPQPAPTGLGRFDALRSMIAAGVAPDGSAVSPDILRQQQFDDDVPVDRVAPSTPRRHIAAVARSTDPAAHGPARQAYTEAGPATGPGALGRRMQPEMVAPGTRPTPTEPRPRTAARATAGPASRAAPGAPQHASSAQPPFDTAPEAPPNPPVAPLQPGADRRRPGDSSAPPPRSATAPTTRRERDARRSGGRPDASNALPPAGDDAGPPGTQPPIAADGGTDRSARALPSGSSGGAPGTAAGSDPADPISSAMAVPGAAGPLAGRDTAVTQPRPPGIPLAARTTSTVDDAAPPRATTTPRTAPPSRVDRDEPTRSFGPTAVDTRAPTAGDATMGSPRATTADAHPPGARDSDATTRGRTHGTPPPDAATQTTPTTDTRPPSGRAGDTTTPTFTPEQPATAPTTPGSRRDGARAEPGQPTAPRPIELAHSPVARSGDFPRVPHPPPAGDLRVQRLIAAGPTHRPAPARRRARDQTKRPESSDVDTIAVDTTQAVPPWMPRERAQLPRLPGSEADGHPVRRVTLPRAMSRVHRPSTPLVARTADPDAAPVIGDGAPTEHRSDTALLGAAGAPTAVTVRPPAAVTSSDPADIGSSRVDSRTFASPPRAPSTLDMPSLDMPSLEPATGPAPRDRVSARRRSVVAPNAPTAPTAPAGQRAARVGRIGRNSVVATGADVLRRALAGRAQPQHPPVAAAPPARPGPSGDAGLPVAPAARVARDVTPVDTSDAGPASATSTVDLTDTSAGATARPDGRVPTRRDVGTASDVAHAAGRPRSEAGVALAERFMTELSRKVRAGSAPLPTTFRPLADQIAGRRAVALSTDATSRRALRSVGKRAATVGDTIHLDASAQQLVAPTARLTEVVAHELTHVAHPSPAPRFFDDIDESPEERRAEAVARVISRAPVAPTNSTLTAPFAAPRPAPRPAVHGRRGAGDVIRRELADTDERPLSVAELTARFGGKSPSRAGSLRSKESPVPASTASPGASPSNGDTGTHAPPSVTALLDTEEARSWFASELDRNSHRILERLEDVVAAQLERRGGRFRGGF